MGMVKLDRWLKDYETGTELIKLKPGERTCVYCNRKVIYPNYFKCRYCGEVVCSDHRIPEGHNCPGRPLSPWEKEMITRALRGGVRVTYEEFIVISRKVPAPKDFEWRFRSLGEKPGTAFLARKAHVKTYDTALERIVEDALIKLGYKEGVDYKKQFPLLGYILDFVFSKLRFAIEPGARKWHNPERDEKKDNDLRGVGWKILWLYEDELKDQHVLLNRIRDEILTRNKEVEEMK